MADAYPEQTVCVKNPYFFKTNFTTFLFNHQVKIILSKFSISEDIVPSFTVKEMVILTMLLIIGGFCFFQSFRSYQDEFNQVLDDIFLLSEQHSNIQNQFENNLVLRKAQFNELKLKSESLFVDINQLPSLKDSKKIIYQINSLFIDRKDIEIEQTLLNYKAELKLLTPENFSILQRNTLSKLYLLIRQKQQDYIYLTNNYRTATYFVLLLIVIFNSNIFIRHYAQERARAIKSNNSKTDFLANMSHEIRTPLNGIIGMSDLIQSTDLTDEQKKYMKSLVISAENLNELINDILDISKIESGQTDIESIPFNLHEMIDDLMISFQLRASHKNVQILKEISENLRPTYTGDPTRIKQILINLIGNALKFTETGHVRISAQEYPDDVEKILIEVEDTGIGIPDSKRATMFQKFSQADNSTTRKYGGTGLGLAICKNLVSLMGGQIDYKGNSHGGTTFWFTLHLPKATADTALTNKAIQNSDFFKLKGKHILIAEDNKVNQEYALKILKEMGLTTHLAETGVSVVQIYKQNPEKFSLILMDCRMPEMDGYEATQHIREFEKKENLTKIPIVALTANAFKSDIDKCIASGMDGYLAKPIHRHLLETAVNKWITGDDVSPQIDVMRHQDNYSQTLSFIDKNVYSEMKQVMEDAMPSIVSHYIESIPDYIKNMKDGFDTKSPLKIAEAAHPLKSSSASLGAMQLREICAEIEKMGRTDKDVQDIQPFIDKAEQIAFLTVKELEKFLNETA